MPILPFFIYLFTYAIFIKKESVIISSSVSNLFLGYGFLLKRVYGENKNYKENGKKLIFAVKDYKYTINNCRQRLIFDTESTNNSVANW